MNFIDLVLESTQEYEAPRRFYYWAALTAVSAVLRDKVWFDMGKNYKLYPNIYVLLYGPSGVRKGPAIALAEKVVNYVDVTKVINGRSSIEAIIKELGTAIKVPGKPIKNDSSGFVVASELSSSIISNPSAMDIMTNLFDRIYNEGEWKYKLKVGESTTLKNPTITWLAGTNESLFKEFVPEKNIHGGLIGRMFLVTENRPNRLNSLMFDPNRVPDVKQMGEALLPASKLTGPFDMDVELRKEVDEWYKNFMTLNAPQIQDETGFVSRILDFLMKNAMIISSGRRADKIILKEDWDESVDVTLPLIVPTKKISQSIKKTDVTEVQKRGMVLRYLCRQEGFAATRKEILRNLGLQINHEDLDKVVDLLLQIGGISLESKAGEITYKLNTQNPKIAGFLEGFKQ